MDLRVQPQTIMEPLFPTSTIHLIYLFTIPVKLEGGSVPNVLSCFWAFIDVCVYKGKLWKIIAQSTECWENLDTNGTPEKPRNKSQQCILFFFKKKKLWC